MLLSRRALSLPVFVVLIGAFVVAGCGGGGGNGIQIEVGERSPAIDGAAARITSPADSAVLDSPAVQITVEAENFETGAQTKTPRAKAIAKSANGQHFHVIVDNGPYMANYEAGTPFDLGTLSPGAHTVFVFASRSYHESVKGPDAFDVVNFYVQEESGEFMLGADDPAIVYSRPKGTYTGAGAERIMLDFYLHNVELSPDGYRARYTIRSTGDQAQEVATVTLTEWTPAFVTGLSSGTYEVNLQLLDGEGNVVPGPFNDTTREIVVETAAGQSS